MTQFRCTGGFTTADRIIAGGQLVDGDDPIVETHRAHFTPVAEPGAPRGETASTATPRKRGRPKKTVEAPADEAAEGDAD